MAIYQNAERNKILLNAYGVVIDSSLILCYDAGNPYSFVDPHRGTGASSITETVYDLSTVGNSGNIVHYLDNITTGSNGGVFTFPGSANTVFSVNTTTIVDSFNATTLSISIWVKPTDTAGTTTQMDIITNRNGGPSANDRGVYISTARQLVLNTGTNATNTGAFIVPNEWYHLAIVHSSTNLRFYVNSVLRYTRGSASTGAGGIVGIGSNPILNLYYLLGQIGLPMVYNRELLQADITQNYTSQAARFDHINETLPPLKLYFDPGNLASYDSTASPAATKIYDLSGNNYTGSLSASFTADKPVYTTDGGGSFYFNGQASSATGTSGSYIGAFTSGSSAPGLINLGNTYTIDMWIKMSNIGTGFTHIWISSNAAGFYQNYITTAGNNANDTGGTTTTLTANITANSWYNLVTVRSGDTMWSYVNGLLLQSFASNLSTTNFNFFRLGGYYQSVSIQNTYYPRGYLGAFKIYNGTLTGVQVYNNFQSSRARYGV